MKDKVQPTVAELEILAREELTCTHPHYHKDESGFLVQCYHVCSKGVKGIKETLTSVAFWVGVTVSYPFEHLLWERVPGFSHIAHLLGMH